MDNEEIQGVKFSEFPSATPNNADEVVGLHSGDNARFSIANIVAAVRQGLASIFVPLTRTINNKALSTDISLDASDVGAVDTADVGVADGVASLDSTGKVPGTQLDLSGAQPTITANGILKGDGAGGVSAAVSGTDYQTPLTAGTDYATPAQLDAKANLGQIGYPETGTTASRNYTAGEYICWNGLTYTADTNIALGATLSASGGNKNLTECVGGGVNTLNAVAAKVTPFDVASNSYVDVSIGYGIISCVRYANGQYVTRVLFEIIAGGNPALLMDIGTQTGRVTAAKQSNGVVRISSSSTVTINGIAIGI